MNSYPKIDAPHAVVHEEANLLASECTSGDKALCSKDIIEMRVTKIEAASHKVGEYLDAIVKERADMMMREASIVLFKQK